MTTHAAGDLKSTVNLPDTPTTQLDPWLPDQWKARQDAQGAKNPLPDGLPVLPTPMLPPAAAPQAQLGPASSRS